MTFAQMVSDVSLDVNNREALVRGLRKTICTSTGRSLFKKIRRATQLAEFTGKSMYARTLLCLVVKYYERGAVVFRQIALQRSAPTPHIIYYFRCFVTFIFNKKGGESLHHLIVHAFSGSRTP